MSKEIYLQGYGQKWSLGNDFENYKNFFPKFGLKLSKTLFPINKIVYLKNKYTAYKSNLHLLKNDLVFDYFHGDPNISPEFKDIFDQTIKNINKFSKIRVSNSIIENLFISNNLENKIFKIHLGVDTNLFKFDKNLRTNLKDKFKIPKSSIVIGSFQKDSNGWENSKTPKMIKGPDIFIEAIRNIYSKVDNIFIVLVGPERGYVKQELSNMNIPFIHFYEKNYFDVIKYYSLIDFYFITSREEGGPKALLESMACGVPVISTPVGQSVDIINNKNSFITNSFDSSEISEIFLEKIKYKNLIEVKIKAQQTAKLNDFRNQKELWKNFFKL